MACVRKRFLWFAVCVLSGSCDFFSEDDDSTEVSGSTSCDASDEDALSKLECDVFDLVNQQRAVGANCGSEGVFPRAKPLLMYGVLTEAARLHSLDMGENDFFDHTNLQGEGVDDRVNSLGYTDWGLVGENIAAGSTTAEGVMSNWMNSDGHCANIMNAEYSQIGIGLAVVNDTVYKYFWTQVFATPQ